MRRARCNQSYQELEDDGCLQSSREVSLCQTARRYNPEDGQGLFWIQISSVFPCGDIFIRRGNKFVIIKFETALSSGREIFEEFVVVNKEISHSLE